jgi:hypothetical protein
MRRQDGEEARVCSFGCDNDAILPQGRDSGPIEALRDE